jgi:uncharacterized membrane protein YphA (DoxX/SURF4 family)
MISRAPSIASAGSTASTPSAGVRRAGRGAAWWIGTAAGVFLGLVLLVAAWAKALDPQGFADQVRAEGLAGLLPSGAVALAAIGLEVGLGAALVLGVRRLWVLLPAVALVAFFLFLTGRAYWKSAHGEAAADAGCGCFGNLVQRSPAEAFWEDLALLVPALALAFAGRETRPAAPRARTALALAATAGALLLAWKSPELPLDDLATRLRPGVRLADLCAGAGKERVCLDGVAPALATGRALGVIADLDDPAFQRAVRALNAYARGYHPPAAPALTVLSATDADRQQAFTWRFGPAFPVVEAPAALLKPLYRRLPRAFVVEDGRVVRTYSGLPPLPGPA